MNEVFDSDQATFHLHTFYFNLYFEQFENVYAGWKDYGVRGVGGVPPIHRSNLKVSIAEYMNMFNDAQLAETKQDSFPENSPLSSNTADFMDIDGSLPPTESISEPLPSIPVAHSLPVDDSVYPVPLEPSDPSDPSGDLPFSCEIENPKVSHVHGCRHGNIVQIS